MFYFFFSSRRRHTRSLCDWSSDVCSSDLSSCRTPWPTGCSSEPTTYAKQVLVLRLMLRVILYLCTSPLMGSNASGGRSEEHTSELQSHSDLVCRLLLEKKKKPHYHTHT